MTDLWDWNKERYIEQSSQRGYDDYRKTPHGKHMYMAFVDRALRLRHRGWKHFGAQAILEVIRFEAAERLGPDAMGVKVNNNWAAYLAREAMEKNPDLEGFFETRRSKADA